MPRAAKKPKPSQSTFSYTVKPLYPNAGTHCWRVLRNGQCVLSDLSDNSANGTQAALSAIWWMEQAQVEKEGGGK